MDERQKGAPPEVQKTMAWLRNKSGMKLKTGILNGKRVDYFKGKSALKALQSPAYNKQKSLPKFENEEGATQFLNNSLVHTFYFKVNRGQSVTPQGPQGTKQASMKMLEIDRQQRFLPEEYYVWFLEGSKVKSFLGGILMVSIILAGVMFPLWPTSLRIGVWYLSMAMLGVIALFFGLAIFRLIFYVITIVAAKPGIWIFPNLFADVGFVDSFIPGWDWDLPPPKKKKRKAGELKSGESKKSKKSASRTASPLPAATGASTSTDAGQQNGNAEQRSATITELSD